MNLNDICNNERFAKGELYGSRNGERFLQKTYLDDELYWHTSEGKSYYLYDDTCSGFSLHDINANDWKLYEFIDGEMIEVKEDSTVNKKLPAGMTMPFKELAKIQGVRNIYGQEQYIKPQANYSGEVNEMVEEESNGDKLSQVNSPFTWDNIWGPVLKEGVSKKEITDYKIKLPLLATNQFDKECMLCNNAINGFCFYDKDATLICNDCATNKVQSGRVEECKHLNIIDKCLTCMPPIYVKECNDCGKEISRERATTLTHGRTSVGHKDYIMQPTEAARWMRENPGKVIEAVEDSEVKLMNDDGVIKAVFINEDQIEKMYERLDWGFFAYTYRILEE